MKKSGFTMIELIFVIVIIGILAATAVPKFNDVLDNAKANSELSAMNSLDGAIVGKRQFRLQDYNDNNITWHDENINDSAIDDGSKATAYTDINSRKGVLKAIMNKGEKFKIIGFADDVATIDSDDNASNDILLITGTASDSTYGLKYQSDAPNSDIAGKPDKNDFWVFNPNTYDINVSISGIAEKIISAQSTGLVDVNGTDPTVVGGATVISIVETGVTAVTTTNVNVVP